VNAMKDKDGRINHRTQVSGTMDSPSVTPDFTAAKNAAMDKLKQQGVDQLKKKAGDILNGLIHH